MKGLRKRKVKMKRRVKATPARVRKKIKM